MFDILRFFLIFFFNIEEIIKADHDLQPPQVVIANGNIEGTWRTSIDGRLYAAFEGIPYAKPPIADLRFKEPQPSEPWTGTWKADKLYECPQVTLTQDSTIFGEEDCLYLNVFVPKTKYEKKLDVLVNIHGGAYYAGNAMSYIDPNYMMDRDWILVTMNYRLGALGFLTTEDEIAPGNNGLKDQTLALKWVQENIENFGGNPDSVTLTGFSSGAAAAHIHYFSPWNEGLYHRGWSFSGNAYNAWAFVEEPLQKAQKLSKTLGCDFSSNQEMVNCLRQRPASLIVRKTMDNMYPFPPFPFCPFAPVIEKGSSKPFVAKQPYELLKEKKVLDVPWIVSSTTEDGLFMAAALATRLEIVHEKWTELAKYILDCTTTCPSHRETEIANKIKEYYLSGDEKFDLSNIDKFIKLTTERNFEVESENVLLLQSKATKAPVYYSKFSYSGANGWKQYYGIKMDKGTCHGDDVVYYFGGLITQPMTQKDKQFKEICLDTLYSYVSTGTPVANGVKWTPINEELLYLNVSGPDIIQMEVKKDYSSNEFWRNLNLLENENLFNQKDEL